MKRKFAAQRLNPPLARHVPPGGFTASDAKDFQDEMNIARHEAAHVVAAWMLGVPIEHMQFNDNDGEAEFAAQCALGLPLPVMLSQPMGERLVFALQHGFLTLAGVFGSGAASSDNPLHIAETRSHMVEALSKMILIGGISEAEARAHGARLISVVSEIFDDRCVQMATILLADALIKRHKLTGEEAASVIAHSWEMYLADPQVSRLSLSGSANGS